MANFADIVFFMSCARGILQALLNTQFPLLMIISSFSDGSVLAAAHSKEMQELCIHAELLFKV